MAYSIGFDIFATDKASPVFDKLGGKVGQTEGKFSKFSGAAKLAVAGAGVAIVKFGADSVAAFTDAEAQQRVLTDAYGRFPAMADVTVQSLRDQAQALQSVTKFDGDATAAMMGSLGQYKLTGKQISDLTPLVLDYAQKTGKDLPTAVSDMGKAMLGQGKALKGVGINFKDLKDPTKNFDQLMGGLRRQVGGFAAKEGKSAEGRAAILKNKFGDIQETVGGKLQPALLKLTDAGLKVVDWMGQNEGTVKVLGTAIGALLVTIGLVTGATKAWTVAQNVAKAAAVIWTGIQWLLNVALIANPIGLVVVAIGLLIGGIVLIATKTTWFQTMWKAMTDALGKAWQWMWNTILAPIIRFVLNGFASIVSGIANMLDVLGNIPGFGWAKTAADKMKGAADKARALADNIKDIPDKKDVKVNVMITATGADLPSAFGFGGMKRKAAGGPTRARQPYLVGEEGPELWSETSSGFITNAADTARLLAGRGGSSAAASGPPTVIRINVNGALDPTAVSRQILTMLQRLKGSGVNLELV